MNIIHINSNAYELNDYVGIVVIDNPLKLTLSGQCVLTVFDFNQELEIFLEDNAMVTINFFSLKKKFNSKIITKQQNNSTLKIIESFINEADVSEEIKNYITGNNNKCEIIIRCISKFNIHINLLSKVKSGTTNNELIQNAKAIIEKGIIEIDPNIEVDTLDVSANHFISILNIDQDNLSYLQSKGINEENAKKLIKEGLLYNIFDKKITELIRKEYYE